MSRALCLKLQVQKLERPWGVEPPDSHWQRDTQPVAYRPLLVECRRIELR